MVKLADFGCAKSAVGTRLRTTVGTDGYIAPEIYGYGPAKTSVYSFKVDIWSLGCLIYVVLTKEQPFRDFRQYYAYTDNGGPFPEEQLVQHGVSELGIIFIMEMMGSLPETRLAADEALRHPWLSSDEGTGHGIKRRPWESEPSNAEPGKPFKRYNSNLEPGQSRTDLSTMMSIIQPQIQTLEDPRGVGEKDACVGEPQPQRDVAMVLVTHDEKAQMREALYPSHLPR